MKKIFLKTKILFAAVLLSMSLSCSNDDDADMEQQVNLNIVELAQSESELSNLVAALQQADAGLVETLSGNGPLTVFAPSNDAFSDLLDALGDDYNSLSDFDEEAEKDLLRDILLYHVLTSKVMAADLAEGNVSTALSNNSIEVIASGNAFVLGDASDANTNITAADITASNGVVHLIDKVLLPQSAIDFVSGLNSQNIPELAMATADLSLLVDALVQADADLVATLSGDGPFTVFAPTNTAFASLLDDLGDDYNSLADFDTAAEKELLAKILTYHVVGASALSTDLSDGQEIGTVQGENVTINLHGGVFIDDATEVSAEVILADQMANNGVVHVIDKVLLPQSAIDFVSALNSQNIPELAIATADLSLLVDALVQADADLVATLSGDGPFTVFAPTNTAFASLLDDLGDDYNSLADFDTAAEKELLAKILTYHVVGASALSTDLSDGQEIGTVQGENVTINLHGGVFIDDATEVSAEVILADQMANNGVVHVIDKVLLPQEVLDALKPNVVELAQSVDDLSLLVDALVQADADLVATLSGDGPFTVFAPTNAAFASLLDTLGDQYTSLADFDTEAEKELLAKILTYHVVGASALSTDLSDGQEIETVQGETVTINLHGGVFIDDATEVNAEVILADQMASNGVAHVINKVLLPQEVLDLLGH